MHIPKKFAIAKFAIIDNLIIMTFVLLLLPQAERSVAEEALIGCPGRA